MGYLKHSTTSTPRRLVPYSLPSRPPNQGNLSSEREYPTVELPLCTDTLDIFHNECYFSTNGGKISIFAIPLCTQIASSLLFSFSNHSQLYTGIWIRHKAPTAQYFPSLISQPKGAKAYVSRVASHWQGCFTAFRRCFVLQLWLLNKITLKTTQELIKSSQRWNSYGLQAVDEKEGFTIRSKIPTTPAPLYVYMEKWNLRGFKVQKHIRKGEDIWAMLSSPFIANYQLQNGERMQGCCAMICSL